MSYVFNPFNIDDTEPSDGFYSEVPGFHQVAILYFDNEGNQKVYYEVVWAAQSMALAVALATLGIPVAQVTRQVVRAL